MAQIEVKMGWILYLNEQYSAAERQISYALELDPTNLEAIKTEDVALLKLGIKWVKRELFNK